MEEKTLLRLSMIVGIFGVILLYLISSNLELPSTQNLQGIEEGKTVKIQGKIGKVTNINKTLFLEVLNEKIERTPVILFKQEDINLKPGDYVEITGTLETYQGEKEVIGNKVVKK